jgi:hypothetical protein
MPMPTSGHFSNTSALRDKSKSIERSSDLINRARRCENEYNSLSMTEKERYESEMYHRMKNQRIMYRQRKSEIEHIQKMKRVNTAK